MIAGLPSQHVTTPTPDRATAHSRHSRARGTGRLGDDVTAESPLDRDPERLFEAVGRLLAHTPLPEDGALRPLVRAVVLEARLLGIYPEMLIRLIKESWRSLPDPPSSTARLDHLAALDRLVTLCIVEYFRSDLQH